MMLMMLPIKFQTYVTAREESKEYSKENVNKVFYLFHSNEGFYILDDQAGAYSNETLVHTILNGNIQ